MRTQPIFGVFCLLLGAKTAAAAPEGEDTRLWVAWKPSYQMTHVMYGPDSRGMGMVVQEGDDGAEATMRLQLPRLEVMGVLPLGESLGVYAHAEGGTYALQLSADQALNQGGDALVGAGGELTHRFSDAALVRARLGLRVYRWFLDDIPPHGNLGMVYGIEPQVGPVSVLFEGTLAAIAVLDDPAIGAQRDSSTLRARAAYGIPLGDHRVLVGAEWFHTKTEFFGTQAIPGHAAFAQDDLLLSGVLAAEFSL